MVSYVAGRRPVSENPTVRVKPSSQREPLLDENTPAVRKWLAKYTVQDIIGYVGRSRISIMELSDHIHDAELGIKAINVIGEMARKGDLEVFYRSVEGASEENREREKVALDIIVDRLKLALDDERKKVAAARALANIYRAIGETAGLQELVTSKDHVISIAAGKAIATPRSGDSEVRRSAYPTVIPPGPPSSAPGEEHITEACSREGKFSQLYLSGDLGGLSEFDRIMRTIRADGDYDPSEVLAPMFNRIEKDRKE